MTMQEVFDKVYAHAQTMTMLAANDGACMYRSPNGPCLIGILVSDKEAERADAVNCPVDNAIDFGFFTSLDLDKDFYLDLQECHDTSAGEDGTSLDKAFMMEKLHLVAKDYGLKV